MKKPRMQKFTLATELICSFYIKPNLKNSKTFLKNLKRIPCNIVLAFLCNANYAIVDMKKPRMQKFTLAP